MAILHLNETNFKDQVLKSNGLILVDFWAPWCGPCKMIAPALEDLDREYANRVKIAKVNVDESPQVASGYGIMSIPTIFFFKNGQVANQLTGVVSKSDLKKKIEEHI